VGICESWFGKHVASFNAFSKQNLRILDLRASIEPRYPKYETRDLPAKESVVG
jgi:hypothetical protein